MIYASIIIPVAAAHAHHVATAIASCRWQTLADWEAIVVNDTGRPLQSKGDDRITVIDAPGREGNRAAIARNAGIEVARGTFTIFLDADDYLLPSAIETFTRGHARHAAAYSYAHHYGMNRAGLWAQYRPPEYDREALARFNLHPITAFVPTTCLRDVGGFDEAAPGLEDWTVWLRLAIAGHCGERVYGPTFVYRRDEGVNHVSDIAGGQALMDAVIAPYRDKTGAIPMAGCGCGGRAATAKETAQRLAQSLSGPAGTDDGMVMLEYIGAGEGKQSFRHPVSRREYRAGRGAAARYVQAPPEDVDYLVNQLRMFARVPAPAAFVAPPQAEVVQAETIAESVSAPPVEAAPRRRTRVQA